MRIALAADQAGFELKNALKVELDPAGHEIVDLGAHALQVEHDYPDFAEALERAILRGA